MTKLYNLARMSTLTTGTGTITLNAAVNGALTFEDAGVQDGESISYTIRDGVDSEAGRGTYTASGKTLSRDTVLASTNGGAKIELSGAAEVAVCMLVEDLKELFMTPASDVVMNENGGDFDFRVEGDADENLLFLNAGTDRVGIGTAAPTSKLHVYGSATIAATIESYTDQAQLVLSSNKDGLGGAYSIVWFNDYGSGKWYLAKDASNHFVLRDQANGRYVFKANAGGAFEINSGGVDLDFIVQGDTDANLLFVDAGNDKVGIGGSSLGGKFNVIGNSDIVQALIKGHSTQTSNLQEWRNSANSLLVGINGSGNVGIGTTPPTTSKLLAFQYVNNPSTTMQAAHNTMINNLTGNNAYQSRVNANYLYLDVASGIVSTGTQAAYHGAIYLDDSNEGTVTFAYGNYFYSALEAGAQGTVVNFVGFFITHYSSGANTAGYTNWTGFKVEDIGGYLNGATVINQYGVYVNDIDSGDTLNYAIYTNAGDVRLMATAADKIGLFGVTPVVQQAHIVDADGSLADITTKFNTLLAQLESYGLLAAA